MTTINVACICGSMMIKGVIQQGEPKCANINCVSQSAKGTDESCYYCPAGAGSAGQHPLGFFYCNTCAITVSQNGAVQQQTQTQSIEMTANNSKNNDNITVEMMKQQNNQSCFKNLFDVESIREHIDVEFEKMSSFKVFKGIVIIYIFSVIDIVTDILFTLKISALLGNDCAKQLMDVGAINMSYAPTVIFLWISTLCAIIYTAYCKYYAAYKASKKFQISYWNGLKWVAVTTQLKLDMSHSNCWNKYQFLRLLIVFLEDVIQLFIGYLFIFAVHTDAIVLISTMLSTLAVVYTIVYSLYRLFRDIIRKILSCCCLKHNVCSCKCIRKSCHCCDLSCYWIIIIFVLLLTLYGWLMLVAGKDENVFVDYGFMYAEAEFNITDLELELLFDGENDQHNFSVYYDVYNHSINTRIFGSATNARWCFDMNFDDITQYITMDIDGSRPFAVEIDNKNEINFKFPAICLRVRQKYLNLYFMGGGTYLFATNRKLDMSSNVNTLTYPDDYSKCDGFNDQTDDCSSRPQHIIVASWTINYRFKNMVNCDAI
eukprot:490439_1